MFIALNGQRLLIENPAGPEKYTYNIYNALAKIDSKNRYIIYFASEPGDSYFKNLTNGNANFSFKVINSKLSWTQHALSLQLFKDKVDVFFTPVHTLPVVRPTDTKYVSMVHGLEFTHIKTNNIIKKAIIGETERFICRFSDALIVPSDGTKQAIIKNGWRMGNDITIVSEGVGSSFYKRTEEEVLSIKKKYNINDSNYLIFVGTIHPRKNLPDTIRAFSEALPDLDNKKIKLVISGKLGWDYGDSLNAAKKYGIEDKVLYLGRVSDEDLPTLISGSNGLINFSLEEGFGLPLLEAMASEVPCAVSDIPCFREVLGEYGKYSDPKNVTEIKNAIIKLLKENNTEMISNAKTRSKEFSWEKSAEKTLGVFQSVIKHV